MRLIATAVLDGKRLDCEPMPMHRHMLIFGMGYTASRLADSLRESGWHVTGTRRMSGGDAIAFDDEAAVCAAIETAILNLEEKTREALSLKGVVRIDPQRYLEMPTPRRGFE